MNLNSIELLLNAINQGSIYIERTENGWITGIKIPIANLDGNTKYNLSVYLTGGLKGDFFIHWIADNNEEIIEFEKQDDALNTIRAQIPHIEKKVIFSVYQNTGTIYHKPKGNVLSFHHKK